MQPMMAVRVLASVLALLGLASGTGWSAEAPKAAGKTPVIATFSILGEAVAKVGGDRVAVTTLVGPGGDAHTYEPAPADAKSLVAAALIVENGLNFEPWLNKLYRASGSKVPRVVASTGIKPRAAADDDDHHQAGQAKGHEHGHDHGDFDPHVWQNPQHMSLMVQNLEQALCRIDPAGAAVYRANAAAYRAELAELDRYLAAQTAKLPPARRILVTSHDALGYFAERYGFASPASALSSVTTEAADPSAQQVATVVAEIRKTKVPAIFTENMANPRLMAQIAKEAKVRVDTTLFTDALGPAGSPGDTYVKMMRYNIDTIVKALQP